MNFQVTHLQVFRPGSWQWLFALGLSVMLLITIATLIQRLDRAEALLNSNDVAAAAEEMKGFQTDWLQVEGIVATKSKQAYVDIENNMAKAYRFLKASPEEQVNNILVVQAGPAGRIIFS